MIRLKVDYELFKYGDIFLKKTHIDNYNCNNLKKCVYWNMHLIYNELIKHFFYFVDDCTL